MQCQIEQHRIDPHIDIPHPFLDGGIKRDGQDLIEFVFFYLFDDHQLVADIQKLHKQNTQKPKIAQIVLDPQIQNIDKARM